MAQFNHYLDVLDLSEVRALCMSRGELMEYARDEAFLRIGEVPEYLGFVESGYFKYVVRTADEVERVVGLSFEDDYVGDINSALAGSPTEVSVVAGQRSRVWTVGMGDFIELVSEKGMGYAMGIEVSLFRTLYIRYLDMYRLTPMERYVKILTMYPDILQRVPLRELASFLCITPVHLSRLRKSIVRGGVANE
jgi:CRP-like cAMP-binding protein